MRSVATLATGSLIASVAHAQVVQWDIAKRETKAAVNGLRKREASTYEEIVNNEKNRGGYFATTKVGTPGQDLTLQLDTGSSDIWVPASSASVCTETSSSSSVNQGCDFGSFDYEASTSFDDVGPGEFSISYVDGSHSKGDYFTDNFEIGGATLTNVTMGLGLDTDIPYGLVGVGYALNEAAVAGGLSEVYDNLPVQMQKEGLIATNAYSLWLNDLDAGTGSILFGGIDTDKYEGDLSRMDIIKDPQTEAFTSFIVYMTSMSASSSSGTDALSSRQFPIPVVLDSGTTLSYLPTDLATQIWNEAGAVYSSDVDVAVIPCSMETSKGTFEFGFAGDNGPKISVGMDELVLSLTTGDAPKFQTGAYKGQDACQFGIQNFSSDPFLLGDTFLRSAYVVYDLVNNQVALAKTDFNATTSNIVQFPSKGAQIPSATVVANQVTASAATGSLTTPTYGASAGFTDSGSDGSTSAAVTVPAFDWAQVGVIGATVVFTLVGSGFFLL
ncbi:aspartic peptidase domain-containing protein [Pseudomassariella vexata]|uniref:Probable aspartic-type endopeptidase OPSB n=1 Tax=Pseudomassariella vexata TaxID=1141098 RepID=A0A1Y2EF75_9PEZI|nr:aspartic peptidase domain-containing protein [Pseudomassariella vexata]ORY70238.1 aspartic peptidase domain-containing protein [Pseudomassariella vexata]